MLAGVVLERWQRSIDEAERRRYEDGSQKRLMREIDRINGRIDRIEPVEPRRPAMSEANGTAAADLVAALGELAEVQAGQTADTGTYKYKYADLAQIMTTVRPILARHNLAVTQLVSSTHEGELLVRTVLLHGSGAEFDMDPLGAKMPVTPQQVGSFISYFRRYQLTSRLGIAVEDDDGQAAAKAVKRGPVKKAPRGSANTARRWLCSTS